MRLRRRADAIADGPRWLVSMKVTFWPETPPISPRVSRAPCIVEKLLDGGVEAGKDTDSHRCNYSHEMPTCTGPAPSHPAYLPNGTSREGGATG